MIVEALGSFGPKLMLKLQTTASAWSDAHESKAAWESPGGTVMPSYSRWVGAASTQTVHTMVKPTATMGTMMARPAGIRAR